MKKIYLLFFAAILSAGSFAQFVPVVSDPIGTSPFIVVGNSNYHASESIYTDAEIGHNNYTTAGSAIQQIFFLLEQSPNITTVNNFSIYMKNVPIGTTTFANGTYSLAGYTQVFNGTYNVTPIGLSPIILTTPFVRTAGTNLQMLIIRNDNVIHATTLDAVYDAALGSNGNINVTSSRRYNNTTAPTAGVTTLAATIYRPLIIFNHTFAIDAIVNDIYFPPTSCYNSPQSVAVEVINGGTTNIAAGAAATTLKIRGANTFTATQSNTAVIAPGASEFITFNGINLNNLGTNFDTAYVTLPGDGTTYYDSVYTVSEASNVLTGNPLTEDMEEFYPLTPTSGLDVFSYSRPVVGNNAWFVAHGAYSNDFQPTPLVPLGAPTDTAMLWFDSFSEPDGTIGRAYTRCIAMPAGFSSAISFYMNHDDDLTELDSMYVSVSTDRGASWTRIQGFQRYDASAAGTPFWRQETVNLLPYTGQTIQIAFEGVSHFGNSMFIDNITIATTLPVSVLNFDARRNGKVNDLNWRTSQELNSSKFIIERSTDAGRTFTEIGQVAAAGNSNTVRSYSFTDANPIKGYNYYRLRVVDIDNSFKYSDVRNVRNVGAADFSFVNPVQNQLKIKLDADKADKGFLYITDMSGKQMYSSNITVAEGSNNINIEAGRFAQGSYIITIQLDGEKLVKRFTKL